MRMDKNTVTVFRLAGPLSAPACVRHAGILAPKKQCPRRHSTSCGGAAFWPQPPRLPGGGVDAASRFRCRTLTTAQARLQDAAQATPLREATGGGEPVSERWGHWRMAVSPSWLLGRLDTHGRFLWVCGGDGRLHGFCRRTVLRTGPEGFRISLEPRCLKQRPQCRSRSVVTATSFR